MLQLLALPPGIPGFAPIPAGKYISGGDNYV